MKKHILPALALMAAASGAQAQSSVTLFALVDLNLSHYSAGGLSGAGSTTKMQDGTVNGMNGSRWGVRATEDLGGGMKAGVLMEAGVLVDTGTSAQGGRAFGRQTYVSLSSNSLGEVRLGRQYLLQDSVLGMSNPFSNALTSNPGTSITNKGKNIPFFLNAPRADNVVQVESASLGGLKLAMQVAPGEGTNDRFTGLRAMYSAGPLNAAITYEWNKPRGGGADTNKSLNIDGNYNLGAVKLMAGLQQNRNLATGSGNGAASGVSNLAVSGATSLTLKDQDGYTFGAEMPVGQLATVGANYSTMKYKGTNGGSLSLGKMALVGRYLLSKNTLLYASVSFASGDLKDYIAEKTVTQVGMRTAF
jgi:GBP family porin